MKIDWIEEERCRESGVMIELMGMKKACFLEWGYVIGDIHKIILHATQLEEVR